MARQIRSGDVRAIARAITLLESGVWTPSARALLRELYPDTGKAFVLGITGSPGVGKSTLVEKLVQHYRASGARVGVLAVDPSSPFSGGAVLGDRIRMQAHASDPDVFIRSMATRGQLGGLAPALHEALIVLDAASYDYILLETVGVGQDEVDIVYAAFMVVVVLAPGLGDDVQAIKAGLMEIADAFVLNKADRQGAARTEREILALIDLAQPADGYPLHLVRTVATTGEGIDRLADEIAEYRRWWGRRDDSATLRPYRHRIRELVRRRVESLVGSDLRAQDLDALARKLRNRETDPYTLVAELVSGLDIGEQESD